MDQENSAARYCLGIVCVVMTVIFRGLAALGIWPILVPQNGAGITYVTFDHAAEIFLLRSIARGVPSNSQFGEHSLARLHRHFWAIHLQ
jgi:hypothetical protein